MAEALRNEVSITLGGVTRTMRATFEVMCAIERALGASIVVLTKRVAKQEMGVLEVATVIYHGLLGFDDTRLTLDQVGEAIIQDGLFKFSMPVMDFISRSLNGVKVGKSEKAPK